MDARFELFDGCVAGVRVVLGREVGELGAKVCEERACLGGDEGKGVSEGL